MDKSKFTVAGVVVALALGVFSLFNGSTVVNNPVIERTFEKFGAAGQDFPGPCLSTNGLATCSEKRGFGTASTTICAIKSPGATSTLAYAGTNFVTSSTTASIITIAKSSTPFATTTILGGQFNIAANAQAAYTTTGTTSAYIFSPGQFVVVGMQGGAAATTFSPTGSCSAEFIVL
jgi:hypothetical protein